MPSKSFDKICIIYNPNSTGDSTKNAKDLRSTLEKNNIATPIELIETKHAGHAEDIAASYATSQNSVLLISSSGDGGYHELINGVLLGNGHNITVCVLPSGNANDHFNAMQPRSVAENILAHSVRKIDTLQVSAIVKGKTWTRYAHSYIGIGLTPTIGKELTKAKLNFLNEKWLVIKHLFIFDHVSIVINNKKKRIASMVFGNVNRMSKVIQLSDSNKVDDGKFELHSVSHGSKLNLLSYLFKAATGGHKENATLKSFEFTTLKPLTIQMDGEIYTIDSNSKVLIQSIHRSLTTIL